MDPVLNAYFPERTFVITPYGSGLINHTWKVTAGEEVYILQRVNTSVFSQPEKIAFNIAAIGEYLADHAPDYFFVLPVAALSGSGLVTDEAGHCYRLFPFVAGSRSIDVVQHAAQAYEAAKQFGMFTKMLSGFNMGSLKETLPDFHNLSLRYKQFEQAVETGNGDRKKKSLDAITYLQAQRKLETFFADIISNPSFRKRVTHHDTKISNVLFDADDKAICVIDLDTVMPGYFISDVGDMMRTYLSPAGEDETALSLVQVRKDIFRAIVQGYLEEMRDELSAAEKACFVYAGQFMIYMQALRFLADYLQNDRYYTTRYEDHNYNRALNQIRLLQLLQEEEDALQSIVADYL
ncbi:phosphotransferase enzyme family protein [Sediminibacterium ginsengisoli]|uniref:Ser/Thr protein kinase RdoA involved in Cpx stress response, MazF antagonist n=1 Tax=Sediminibacterium ginsengisoli TaxID=413434 RepID=A0A1T4QJN7_9BACT|nr:aminoglycoside phosphotransferase family protein [Sediminibacterium ginsengisoli]SKA03847.1 Ser/Thr protein kinase RdoA involved in Cpx stress response, MazF antagonist [Sediminibacterium ginsengisoli]